GADFELTPKVKLLFQANHVRFDKTGSLELILFQDRVRHDVGWDLSLGLRWRPFLIDNVIFTIGGATFIGGPGFRDIYPTPEVRLGPHGLAQVTSARHT